MLYVLTTLIIKKLKKETDAIATITSSEKQDCSVSKYECFDLITYSFKQICNTGDSLYPAKCQLSLIFKAKKI